MVFEKKRKCSTAELGDRAAAPGGAAAAPGVGQAAAGAPATATPAKPSLLYGTVVSVDTTGGKVVIASKDGAPVTVTTDPNTKIQVAGKDATLGDVKPGMSLRVSPAAGTAADRRAFPARPPQ